MSVGLAASAAMDAFNYFRNFDLESEANAEKKYLGICFFQSKNYTLQIPLFHLNLSNNNLI